ncbi:MAG: acyl carrier protein [Acidobacteria bacterium]|nr:acyl carrier protein [Acidobacteriota bacterium]
MTSENEQKLADVFRAVMNLEPGAPVAHLRQLNTPAWDSMAHVSLVAALESEFGIAVDIVESLELTSFDAVKVYLAERGA